MNDNTGTSHWWQSEIDYQDDKGYLNLFHPNVTLDIPYDTYGWDSLDEFDALQTPACVFSNVHGTPYVLNRRPEDR